MGYNLVEGVTTRYAEILHKVKIFDGLTVTGSNMSSCTVDRCSLLGTSRLHVWKFKSAIFRYLPNSGQIHFCYVEQVETQKSITKCARSTYFEMKLVPCTIEQMINPDVSKYQLFLNKRGIKVESPKAYGYVKIEGNKYFFHHQYCEDVVIGDQCSCKNINIRPIEISC